MAAKSSKGRWVRRGILLAVALFVVGYGWHERQFMLQNVGSWWAISDQLEHADAVVVLTGAVDVQPFAAADLYKRGIVSTILVENGKLNKPERLGMIPSQAELTCRVLSRLGIPSSAIVTIGDNLSSTP